MFTNSLDSIADNAGNSAEAVITYEVIATPGGTIAVINDLVASGLIDPNIAGARIQALRRTGCSRRS